jgi:dihydrofolate synthase/folylpolyglutamate synthase
VLEVGLGGRLDSTNVCLPAVSVITSISFDHMRQLGNTLAAIAREKAGIIKPGVPVVSGVVDDEPRQVIEQIARQRGSRLLQLGRDFHYQYEPPRDVGREAAQGRMSYRLSCPDRRQTYDNVSLGLLGRHQAANAATALTVLDELARQGWQIPDAALRRGVAEVRWPARVEVAGRQPAVVIDAAHNVASVEALATTLAESFSARERILVFATTRDKEVPAMLRCLLPHFDHVIVTQYQNNPRGVPPEELAAIAAQESAAVRVCPSPAAAWEIVRTLAGEKDLVCITGSFFIAAEMRAQIAARPLQPAQNAVLEPT